MKAVIQRYVNIEGGKIPSVHAMLKGHLFVRTLIIGNRIDADRHRSYCQCEEGRRGVKRKEHLIQQQLERLEVVASVLVANHIGSEGDTERF
jgi:hypothetical protein